MIAQRIVAFALQQHFSAI